MRAVVLEGVARLVVREDAPRPEPGPGQVRVRVSACGVCRTDLHVVDGELPAPKLPLVHGHREPAVMPQVKMPAKDDRCLR